MEETVSTKKHRYQCFKDASHLVSSFRRKATVLLAAGALSLAGSAVVRAQTPTTLHSFDGTDGGNPTANAPLVQATNGSLYGTTFDGGANNEGTVFKITPSGMFVSLYSFCPQLNCPDGAGPEAGLVQGNDGNFYGTTRNGGANNLCPGNPGCGAVFKITPSGLLTTLYSFCSQSSCADGVNPYGTLVQATDGNFYGTTSEGAANNLGTVFKITPSGTLTTLHTFDQTDGGVPLGSLVQATDGNFYGTTEIGGANNLGTVFKITPSGMLTTLHSLSSTDGTDPSSGLVQALDGNFYGTASAGGTGGSCAHGCGTVFTITPTGTLTVLHSFDGTDGNNPASPVLQATDGNFYGTTQGGGANSSCSSFGITGCGTIFKITASGALTTLYNFCSQSGCTDGNFASTVVQDTNGKLYGTTFEGGTTNSCNFGTCGTVFSLSVGLGPFVETQRTFGKVGMAVKILGNNLTGATSVTFNGTAATFTVVPPSLIKTTVPAGATTGRVQVVTPHGTLASNVPFRVLP